MIYHLYLSLHKTPVGKKMNAIILCQKKENNGHETELLEDSETVQAPTTSTVELREPLLDSEVDTDLDSE
jgi:hypothetical protein